MIKTLLLHPHTLAVSRPNHPVKLSLPSVCVCVCYYSYILLTILKKYATPLIRFINKQVDFKILKEWISVNSK